VVLTVLTSACRRHPPNAACGSRGLGDAIRKTGTRNKTEAALLARRNGWSDGPFLHRGPIVGCERTWIGGRRLPYERGRV
jgi:hypothetical protein